MATKTTTPALPPSPSRPAWTTPLFVLLGLVILAVVATQLLGRVSDKDVSSFSATNAAIGSALPFVVSAVVAWLIPQGHSWRVRAPIALMAGLFAIFVSRMWPSTAAVVTSAEAGAAPEEMTTLLSWLIGLPLAGSVAILFMPRQAPRLLKATTLIIMLGTLLAAIPLLRVDMGRGFHFNHDVVWIERFGIHWHVALDGISLWLVVLTLFSTPIAAYASFGSIDKRIKDWCFALLLLEAGMIGTFVALDLFMFYVFWEIMLIPMYVMIGVWGGANRIKAALKFFLYTMAGSLLMLAAILYLAYTYGRVTGGNASFDFFELQRLQLPRHVQLWLWAGFAISFFVKVPMWPVHTWLPDAHTEAPTAGSIILAAVMLKMGTYGYLRFCMGLFPEASGELAATLGGVAVLGGILYGALCAWRQDDVKRLVAYSSVAHLGYVMLGLFAGTQGSIEGALLQMVNHGITTGALFLLVGVIYDRRHTRMLDDFGGLAKPMPIYAALFVITSMASIGVPGLNGFVGEFLIITGTFSSDKLGHVAGIQSVGAALGVILAALYMLGAVQKMFFGPITRDENKRLPDMNGREIMAVAPLVAAMFIFGFAPSILTDQMHGAVERVLADYEYRAKAGTGGKYYDGPIRIGPRRPDTPPAFLGASAEGTDGGVALPTDNPGGAPGGDPHHGHAH
ncbi:MAG: NADH-quinone oxidoreductase subunit M [Myxococcales bacterium]|nr:NADH-quinone oxidoreductase subunit M [Myxococcales bacterium]